MTEEQTNKARHALGLDRRKDAYRNRYIATPNSPDWCVWAAMVIVGDARVSRLVCTTDGDDIFSLTKQGAARVVRDGESLGSAFDLSL